MIPDYPFNFVTIILALVPYGLRVYWDYFRTIAKQKAIKATGGYLLRNITTALAIILVSLVNYAITGVPIWKHISLSITTFFLLFDPTIALLMGKPWSYIGEPNDDSSWYESKLQLLNDPFISTTVRVWTMMLGIWIYYFTSYITS